MAAFLALVSAMCFALAAALQQRGQFTLAQAGAAVRGLAGLFRLVAVPVWLFGLITLANRETPVPGQPTGTRGAPADETLS